MILLRRTTLNSDDSIDTIFYILDRKVEKVQTLVNPFLNATVDSTRHWVGRLDPENKKFEITQTSPFFSPRLQRGNYFRIFVRGEAIADGLGSKIRIEFRLGLWATMLFALTFVFISLTIVHFFRTGNWMSPLAGVVVLTVFVSLLSVQLNRTENLLADLFEIDHRSAAR